VSKTVPVIFICCPNTTGDKGKIKINIWNKSFFMLQTYVYKEKGFK
jgi:hypothetical protein